jgi:hypothetical protein
MKIFDSAPAIRLEQARPRWPIITAVAGITISLALAAMMAYQSNTHAIHVAKMNDDLAASKGEVTKLKAALAATKEKLDVTNSKINICTSNLTVELSKVSAFAKQAGACESLRNKLHLKG